jgi:hypothetical protein
MSDDALDVLRELYRKEKHSFSEQCLQRCFEVQRQFQFDRDRDVPLEHMRRIVEAEVTRLLEQKG